MLFAFFLAQSSWLVWMFWHAVYWTGRNTERDALERETAAHRAASLVMAHADARDRLKIAIDTAVDRGVWTAELPAGSVVESIELAGMSLVSAAMDSRSLAPGSQSYFQGFPVRSDARIAVRLTTVRGRALVVLAPECANFTPEARS